MKATIFFLMLSLGISAFAVFAEDTVVRIDGDRFTLRVQDKQLSEILGALSDQGIRIRIDPRINPTISASFTNRPIGAALASILKSVDYALIWRKIKASVTIEPRLWEIRIFFKGTGGKDPPVEKVPT
jgi:hypothetical protein